jgi:ribosomal-protein-serine acetyltransferase
MKNQDKEIDDEVVLKLLDTDDRDELFRLTDFCRSYLREWRPWVYGTKSVEDTKVFIEMRKNNLHQKVGFKLEFGIKVIL